MVPKFYQKECENDEEVTDRISPVSELYHYSWAGD